MICPTDRLRISSVLQAELGNLDLAGVLFALADVLGLEKALLELNRILADPRVSRDGPAS